MAATESVRILRDQPIVFSQGAESLFGPLDEVAEEPAECYHAAASLQAHQTSQKSVQELEEAARVLREAGRLLASRRSMEAFNLMARFSSSSDYGRLSDILNECCQSVAAQDFARELGTKSAVNLLRHARAGADDTKRVRKLAEAALKVLRADQELEEADRVCHIANYATLHGYLRQWSSQRELCEEVLELQRRCSNIDKAEAVRMKQHLAVACLNLGEWSKAKDLSDEVLQVQLRQLGRSHVDVAWTMRHLGVACGNLGDKERAKRLCLDALKVLRAPLCSDDLEVARMLRSLGNALGDLDDWSLQRQLCEEALGYFCDLLGDDHIDTNLGGEHIDVARARCTLAMTTDSFEMRRRLFTESLAVMERELGEDNMEIARARGELAAAHAALGEVGEALKRRSQSYHTLKQQLPENNLEVAWAKFHWANDVVNLESSTDDDRAVAASAKREASLVLENALGKEAVARACAESAYRHQARRDRSSSQDGWCFSACFPMCLVCLKVNTKAC